MNKCKWTRDDEEMEQDHNASTFSAGSHPRSAFVVFVPWNGTSQFDGALNNEFRR